MHRKLCADLRHAFQDIRDIKWLILLFSLFLATILTVMPTVYEHYLLLKDKYGDLAETYNPDDIVFREQWRDNLPYAPAVPNMLTSVEQMSEQCRIWFDQEKNIGTFYLDYSGNEPSIVLLGEMARSFVSREVDDQHGEAIIAFYGKNLEQPTSIQIGNTRLQDPLPILKQTSLLDYANGVSFDLSTYYVVAVLDFHKFLESFGNDAFAKYRHIIDTFSRLKVTNAVAGQANQMATTINSLTSMYVRPMLQQDTISFQLTGIRYAQHFSVHALLLALLLIFGMSAFLVGLIHRNRQRYNIFSHLGIGVGHSLLQIFCVILGILLLAWFFFLVLMISGMVQWQSMNQTIFFLTSILTLLVPFIYVAWPLLRQKSFGDTRSST